MSVVYFLFQQTMYFTIPLLIVAIGGLFSERSGVTNVALDGIMIFGAFWGILFLKHAQKVIPGQGVLLLALLIAGISGAAFSLLHAYASINMKANQVISGTALNIFAPAFAVYITRSIQKVQQITFEDQFLIQKVPILGSIPVIGEMFFTKVYITTYIGLIILLVSTFVIYKTKFGLRLRACGEHPTAADSVGINVYRIRYMGVIISGFLAGIGGVVLIVPTSTNFNADVGGYGFLALAVLIFGQWNPLRVLLASAFFGFMKTLGAAYAVIPFLAAMKIPSGVYKMMPYIVTIIVLIFTSKHSQAPKAVGQVYDKATR